MLPNRRFKDICLDVIEYVRRTTVRKKTRRKTL